MSNNTLRGELGILHQKNLGIDIKADALIRSVKQIFTRGAVTCTIEDLDVEGAASLVADLITLKGEKIRNNGAIARIEKELE